MGFYYRNPSVFPAIFPSALLAATLEPDIPVFVYSSQSPSDVEGKAQMFRWYRWCVKQSEGDFPDLHSILASFSFRSSIDVEGRLTILYLTARSNRLKGFIHHNPNLWDEISAECQ